MMRRSWLHLVVILFCIKDTACQYLTIAPHGTQIKKLDSGIIFTCNIVDVQRHSADSADNDDDDDEDDDGTTKQPPPDIRWVGPDMEYISRSSGRVYVERFSDYGLRLYITKIQEKDAGIYTCKARLPSSGQYIEQETKMFLFEDIKFENTPTAVQYVIGQSALLECVATGQPEPEISWRFNRRKITHDSAKYRQEERGLRIAMLDLRDNGTYDCRAEVASHGNLRVRTITVDVLYPPVISREPKADPAIKGKQAHLTCEADGNPPITYEWFKEDPVSNTSILRVRKKLHNDGGNYFIRNVDSEHAGLYVCRVSNSLGSLEMNISLNVLVVPRVEEMAPRSVIEGRTAELPCKASGTPPPRIVWRKVDNHEDFTEGLQKNDPGIMVQSIDDSGLTTLFIQAVNRSFSGQYTCTASNGAGKDSKGVTLSVEYPPTINVADDTSLIAWSGEVRNLTCQGHGLPLPTITWLHRGGQHVVENDNFKVISSRTDSMTSSTLQVRLGHAPKSTLYGNYSCIAKNVHGYSSRDFSIREAYTPDVPSNVSVVEETSTWIRLSAEQPRRDRGMPTTHWIVKYELVDGLPSSVLSSHQFHDENNITVSGLQPDTAYNFYLSVANAVGVGKAIKFRVKTQSVPTDKNGQTGSSSGAIPSGIETRDHDSNGGVKNDQPFDASREPVLPSHVSRGSTSGGHDVGDGFGVLFLGATIGIATVMAVLLVAIVACFVTSSKRRRKSVPQQTKHKRQPSTGATSLPVSTDFGFPSSAKTIKCDDDVAVESYCGITPSAPPVEARYVSLQRHQPNSGCGGTMSRKDSRATAPVPPCRQLVDSPSPCPGSGTLQRRAAAHLLQRNGVGPSAGDVSDLGYGHLDHMRTAATEPERPLSMSELPPPPDFLLEGGSTMSTPPPPPPEVVDGGHSGSMGRRRMLRGPPPLLFEVTDGYRSGDSVDDDIDNIDPTIRMPSMLVQPY